MSGVPTIGDLVRVVWHHPDYPGRLGRLVARWSTSKIQVRWLDGTTSIGLLEWDAVLEHVNNLSDEESAELMAASMKGIL